MIREKFLQFFPPPQFLDISCAGVSISDTHVRMIAFEKDSQGSLKIKKFAERKLPVGAIVSGRLNNREEIINTLKDLKKESDIKNIRVSIPEEKAYLFETSVSVTSPQEVQSAIEFKLEENVPLPGDQIIFDYVVSPESKMSDDLRVVVSALPEKFVAIYMDLIHSAGFRAYSLEIESQAIARAVLSKDERGAYIVLHFDTQKAGIYIIFEGVVRFTSTIHLPENWENNLDDIVSEIKKIVTYWHTNSTGHIHSSHSELLKILICGGGFSENVVSQLSAVTGIDTVLSNVWRNVFDIEKVMPSIPFMDSLKYASAIGLALPSEFLI